MEEIWTRGINLTVSEKISRCRHTIAAWSRTSYINRQKKIVELKAALDVAMAATLADDSTISLLNSDLLLAYKAKEEFWKQRSRQVWLSLSDKNTSFFHAATKGRRARNMISVIETGEGTPVFEEEQI